MPSTRRPAAVATITIVLALFVAACSGSVGDEASTATGSTPGAPDTSPTTGSADTDPTPAPLRWAGCGGGFECATLTVPIDYADPAGGTVDLAVTRRPTTRPAARVGSLLVNPGGPGGSGVDMVRAGYGTGEGLADRFDIVGWDPRGVGESEALPCATGADAFLTLDPSPDDGAEQRALDAAAEHLAGDCATYGGALLRHMSTVDNARDLEQLRRALGGEPLTYAGYSYGTAIGLAYAERYPTQVRAMVLDGVVEPDWDLEQLLTAQTDAMDQALASILARCATDVACPVRDPAATYDRLAARIETDPLPAGSRSSLGPADLATAAVESTYSPAGESRFLQGLAAAASGDGSLLEDLAERYRSSVPGYAAYAATTCTDAPHPVGGDAYRAFADRLAARSPRLGASVANEMLPCAYWPAPVTGHPHDVAVSGAPPILVVGTTGDAATPYRSSVWLADRLPGAVLLTYDGRGHTSDGESPCVARAVRAYLADGATPPPGSVCPGG